MKASEINSEPLVSPHEVIGLFKAALEQPDWIEDRVSDQFPTAIGKSFSGVQSLGNPDQGKKRRLSKSLGANPDTQPGKRKRASRRKTEYEKPE